MATVEEYPILVRRVLDEYADYVPPEENVVLEKIYDDSQGHYELLYVGWEGLRRIHGCVVHIDLQNDKVWIQHDGTESGVALDLVEAGIPKEHIVLAFHPPYKRPYTGYAVA